MFQGLCCQLTKPCPKPAPKEGRSNALEYATRDQYEIPKSQITLTRKLGAGNFGEVYQGTWQGKVDVAVKTLKPNTMSPEAFLQEAEIMKKFSHPHLVAMYAVCTEQEPFYIITEYMCNGALLDFLRKETEGGAKHQFDSLISIAAQVSFGTRNNLVDLTGEYFQVANGMAHLERKGLIHRDLAARNVLIGENLIAKVCKAIRTSIQRFTHYKCDSGGRLWSCPSDC